MRLKRDKTNNLFGNDGLSVLSGSFRNAPLNAEFCAFDGKRVRNPRLKKDQKFKKADIPRPDSKSSR